MTISRRTFLSRFRPIGIWSGNCWGAARSARFKVIYGGVSDKDDVVAIQTRSGLQILNQLGANVEVPAAHIAERRTYPPIRSREVTLGGCRA